MARNAYPNMGKKIMLKSFICATLSLMAVFSANAVKNDDMPDMEHQRPAPIYDCRVRVPYEFEGPLDNIIHDGCYVMQPIARGKVHLEEDKPSKAPAYDPCATSNPVLAGKGCLFYINDQVVMSNGDGTITTSAGNVYNADGELVGTNPEGAFEAAYE